VKFFFDTRDTLSSPIHLNDATLLKILFNSHQPAPSLKLSQIQNRDELLFRKTSTYDIFFKIPYHKTLSCSFFKQIISLNTKCGLKHRAYKLFCRVFTYI